MDVGDLRDVRGCPFAAVDVDEQVARHAERQEVDREPADDLIRAQVDREERVDEREEGAGERGDPEPELPRLELVGREDPEEGAGEHHSLEPDVRDPAALREDPAHRRERKRGRVAEHGGEERRPDDDLVEMGDARPGREIAEPDPAAPATMAPQPKRLASRATA